MGFFHPDTRIVPAQVELNDVHLAAGLYKLFFRRVSQNVLFGNRLFCGGATRLARWLVDTVTLSDASAAHTVGELQHYS